MANGQPITLKERTEILRLHAEGVSRNQIAKKLAVGPVSVTRVVTAAGRTFDRSGELAMQTAIVKQTNAEKRAEIARLLLEKSRKWVEATDSPMELYSFGGKDNEFNSQVVQTPPAQAIRDLAQATSVALKTVLESEKFDNKDEASEEKTLLAQLGAALGVVGNEK